MMRTRWLESYFAWYGQSLHQAAEIENTQEREITVKAIETINTPVYATLAEYVTGSIEIAEQVHAQVLQEALHVLFLDLAYEIGNGAYLQIGGDHGKYLLGVLGEFATRQQELWKRLLPYWEFEQELRMRMQTGVPVAKHEIWSITKRKSSDVFAYAALFGANPIPRTVVHILYAKQLERDLNDDFQDLAEDATLGMPNPLLLRMYINGTWKPGIEMAQVDLEQLTMRTGALTAQTATVQSYCALLRSQCPPEYRWVDQCDPRIAPV